VDEIGPGSEDLVAEALDAGAIGREAVLAERKVDAVVHAVAGDDEIWLDGGEDALKPLMEVGAGELAAGVPFFGEAGYGLAAEAEVEHLDGLVRMLSDGSGLDDLNIGATEGDAIAEEENAFGSWQRCDGCDSGQS
jgi:hypothetical protein